MNQDLDSTDYEVLLVCIVYSIIKSAERIHEIEDPEIKKIGANFIVEAKRVGDKIDEIMRRERESVQRN